MSDAKHTPGPWMTLVSRENGCVNYKVLSHIEPAIAIGKECYPDTHQPASDYYGYFQPDKYCDVPDEKIANARLIAAAPELLAACEKAEVVLSKLDTLRHLDKSFGPLDELRAAIAKAKGGAA